MFILLHNRFSCKIYFVRRHSGVELIVITGAMELLITYPLKIIFLNIDPPTFSYF